MADLTVPKAEARKIILHAAGLSKRGQFGRGLEAVFKLIDHLGFVQIDTNYVVERAHHHSIFARVPDYEKEWLAQLQGDARIFEFLTFAAGFMPMSDFRFSLPVKASFLANRRPLTQPEVNAMGKVLNRIAREGPLMARDFENDRVTKSKGWWDWRPSKVALERLHLEGKLATVRGRDFQKIYDLTDNIIPADADRTMPSRQEYARHVVMRSLRTLGIAYQKEIAWCGRFVKDSAIREELPRMVAEGKVLRVNVEGLKGPLYMLPEYKNKKISLKGDAFIISPFDIVNVFRHRLRDFFDFDYQVECFVPKPKRKYGYFSLPILVGDTFVARMDARADRKQGVLVANNLHFEKVKLTGEKIEKIGAALEDFARFNQCSKIQFTKCNDRKVLKALQRQLN